MTKAARTRRYFGTGGAIGLTRFIAQAAQFLGFVVAARFLGVEEFGIYALIMVLIVFFLLFAGFGWPQLAATKDDKRRIALWLATATGLTLSVLFTIAVLCARSFGLIDCEVFWLALCLAPLFLLRARTNVWTACLIVDGRAGRVAVAESSSELVALATVVVALYAEVGLLSLGLAKLAQEVVVFAMVRRATDFPSSQAPETSEMRRLIRFALDVIGGRTISFVNENLSTLLIGGFWGAAETGLYRAGARFASSGREVVFEAVRSASWVTLKDTTREDLRDRAKQMLYWTFVAGMLCLAGLASVADLVVTLLLGSEWAAAAPIAAALAVRSILMLPFSTQEAILSLTGQVRLAPRIALINAVASAALLIAMAPMGIVWAAVSQIFAGVVALITAAWGFNQSLGLRSSAFLKLAGKPLVGTAAMLTAVLSFRTIVPGSSFGWQLVELFGSIALGAGTYGIVLVMIDPNMANRARIKKKE